MIKTGREKRLKKNAELRRKIDVLLDAGSAFVEKNLKELSIHDYRYDNREAIEELGLDEELINQLIEDYVIQILKSKITFFQHIQELKKAELENRDLDYTEFRNLAHKNLGVARNLRIEDSKKLLTLLMKEDDLDYLRLCVKALEVSAVKLHPLCAYETLKLIELKSSL